MARSLVCGTDLTEESRGAFDEALRLGHALGGIVTVIHVVPPAYPAHARVALSASEALAFRQYARRGIDIAARTLDRWVEASAGGGSGPTIETRVLEGNPADVLLETADALDADLIVVGTHGRAGPSRWVLGSVSERVVRLARCATLLVRPKSVEIEQDVPTPEPPCPDCLVKRTSTSGRAWWCDYHQSPHERPRAYAYSSVFDLKHDPYNKVW